ncbi:MFS domain-containing protein [Mycena sanguinolenta]|uniref:MFS domain-containing protein n=1 Tax=Mycena sanguinolenta TaxID=230812 RepID=A0A8H6YYD2_9AGAR|nr:MFS domain-containing protein [Mycena sanguinolenta]
MCAAMIYEPLVGQFGTAAPMSLFPPLLPAQPILEASQVVQSNALTYPLLQVAISVPVQFFYAWRISVIMRDYFIPALIGMASLTSLVGAIWTSIIVHQVKIYVNKPKVNTTAFIWSCCASAADLIITVSLFWSLTRKRTGIKRTDDLLNTIARHAIQTGLSTVTFAALDVSLFVAFPDNTISFFFDFGLPKLYSNSLVSSLNARGRGMGEDIIELDVPVNSSAMFTGSTARTPHTVSDPVAFVKSAVNHTPINSDDILALDMGDSLSFTNPR